MCLKQVERCLAVPNPAKQWPRRADCSCVQFYGTHPAGYQLYAVSFEDIARVAWTVELWIEALAKLRKRDMNFMSVRGKQLGRQSRLA
jgi:hypothetical protein